MTKSAGEYQVKEMSHPEVCDWFKAHIDNEGNVLEEIILFSPFHFSLNEDGDFIGELFHKAEDGRLFVMSDYTLDRDQERIDPKGWDLQAYKTNPVMLWQHEYWRPAIGKVNSPRVKLGQLMGRSVFAPKEVDEFAWSIGAKVDLGILSSGSVGFRSRKIEIVDDKNEPARIIHRKQELWEFSICNVPANPSATTQNSEDEDDADAKTLTPEAALYLSEFKKLEERIAGLEARNNSYIAAIMRDLPRDPNGGQTRETSGLETIFAKGGKKINIMEVLNGTKD